VTATLQPAGTLAADAPQSAPAPELTVVLPCMNEGETLAACLQQIQQAFRDNGIQGEIVLADSSTDQSPTIARGMGARVVTLEPRGYGAAIMAGVAAARGRYILMGDPDGSYDFAHIPRFLEKLRAGADLVMGNRFLGGVKPGAMRPLHRVGNPVMTWIGRVMFRSPLGDFHCGLRAFSREAFERMDLRTTEWELASEMVLKATIFGMKVVEVPTTLSPDGRNRPPHLRGFYGAWRNMRYQLLYSPRWLFLYPGVALLLIGMAAGLWLLPGPARIGAITFDINTLVFAAAAVLLGFQAIAFAVFTKVFAITEGLLPADERITRLLRSFSLETGVILGVIMMLAGLAGSAFALSVWGQRHFGPLAPTEMLRLVIPSALMLALGLETILSSFFLGVLAMARKPGPPARPIPRWNAKPASEADLLTRSGAE